MMKVCMTCNTAFDGERLLIGDIAEVDSQTAKRWIELGIAVKQPDKSKKDVNEDEGGD